MQEPKISRSQRSECCDGQETWYDANSELYRGNRCYHVTRHKGCCAESTDVSQRRALLASDGTRGSKVRQELVAQAHDEVPNIPGHL